MPKYPKRRSTVRKKQFVCARVGCKIKTKKGVRYCKLHSHKMTPNKQKLDRNHEFKLAKQAFQLMIRIRDANEDGHVKCCSCGRRANWKNVDGGHFLPAHRRATCFDEKNVHAQCKRCNLNMNDPVILGQYMDFMVSNYGKAVIEQMMNLSRMKSGFDAHSFQLIRYESLKKAEEMHFEKFKTDLSHRLINKKYENWKNKL